MRHLCPLLLILCAAAPVMRADTITSFHIQLGTWNGTTFTPDGNDWNTYASANWAIGATAPAYGNPVLDGYNNVNLARGNYYLFMAYSADAGNAIELTVGMTSGSVAEVFTTAGGSPENVTGYTLVQGTGFTANLLSAQQTAHEVVGQGQTYTGGSFSNWVINFDDSLAPVPEPGSIVLLLTVAGLAALLARHKLASN